MCPRPAPPRAPERIDVEANGRGGYRVVRKTGRVGEHATNNTRTEVRQRQPEAELALGWVRLATTKGHPVT